ncbi:MAG: carbamoyltransferase C-terminal domain-containing protein [Pseudomonadota bacterium]
MNNYILGVWDGHDSGAAVIKDNTILVAINEERVTRRKLEIKFPEKSIQACLEFLHLSPRDIEAVAVSTSDFSKTLGRLFPSTKEEYYLIRRRKKAPGRLIDLKKKAKYKITETGSSALTKYLSTRYVRAALGAIGFENCRINLVDHHLCHAAAAAFCSGFNECLVVTIDGIGDALSGSISTLRQGALSRVAALSGRYSLGIFFEHVTNLMNMRELEDEGKVMALANYAYPVPDAENPLLDLITINGLEIKSPCSSLSMYGELKKNLWKYPSEQFAYMAQRTIEVKVCELVRNSIKATGLKKIAFAGGIFSNIKLNMHIRLMPEVEACYIFPHMGDGGLALGAALSLNHDLHKISAYPLHDIYLGREYADKEILAALQASGFSFRHCENIEAEAAKLIAAGQIVFWFQGRMEYGPRSLGNRSILALPNSAKIKDILNLRLKMRVWYQPFCPSMLEEDAREILENYDGRPNHFMTMGYMVKESKRRAVEGVTGIDGSCRPQMVTEQEPRYQKLLREIKKLTGAGILLNTSFNIHGEPLVCSPQDALATLKKTGNEYLVMGNYLISAHES